MVLIKLDDPGYGIKSNMKPSEKNKVTFAVGAIAATAAMGYMLSRLGRR